MAFGEPKVVAFLHPSLNRRTQIVFTSSLRADDNMGSLTILYVEDYKLVLLYVKELLEGQGWRVETCQDGTRALEILKSSNSYDVLILDNSLPGINGLELVRSARRLTHRRRTPIIMLSATDSARAAYRAGADAFLKKPEDVTAITETVRRLIGMR
jgi:CheY-like chemotaxis protein